MTLRKIKVIVLVVVVMLFTGSFFGELAHAIINKSKFQTTSSPKATKSPIPTGKQIVLGEQAPDVSLLASPTPTPKSKSLAIVTPTPTVLSATATPTTSSSTSSGTPLPSPSPTPAVISTHLIILSGTDVTITPSTPSGGVPFTALGGEVVAQGSTIETGNAIAQLVYWNGGVTRLDTNTTVIFESEPSNITGGSVFLIAGRIWNNVTLVEGNFKSKSINATATVLGTEYGHIIALDNDGSLIDEILTVQGTVSAGCSNGGATDVTKNKAAIVKCSSTQSTTLINITDVEVEQEEIDWVLSNIIADGDPDGRLANNQAPTVTAEADSITVTLLNNAPSAEVTLIGSATDDGLPFGITPQTVWEPNSDYGSKAVIVSPNSLTTKVNFTKVGNYKFKLIAFDAYVTSASKEVEIRVQPQNSSPN